MKKIKINGLVLCFLVLISCARTPGTVSKSVTTAAAEDLSAFRPKFPAPPTETSNETKPVSEPVVSVTPTHHVNNRVLALIDTVANANKAIKYAQGYRILAYTGTERKTAMEMRRAIIDRIPEERDYLQYRQPTFRLKIGDYLNRIEAQQVLSRIKDISPNALIISDQINVNR
ncbi:sporulation protein [Adhaeribacter radiodurans]|uniref:Sporulation protein n=1 Tax=Adhaeribacter radiodurans TaxID=2745197 RepID=A0A7L7LBT2_9BACT|nr:sporulation protein [Adhaeribacter radiodurans]QMU30233.1 sporulation protein [Adhaeribacter radiodurans]